MGLTQIGLTKEQASKSAKISVESYYKKYV